MKACDALLAGTSAIAVSPQQAPRLSNPGSAHVPQSAGHSRSLPSAAMDSSISRSTQMFSRSAGSAAVMSFVRTAKLPNMEKTAKPASREVAVSR